MKYQLIDKNDIVLHEAESECPFEDLHKFKRKTFGDVFDRQFRASPLRHALKFVCNHGGTITDESPSQQSCEVSVRIPWISVS